jgi:hypothetical protein
MTAGKSDDKPVFVDVRKMGKKRWDGVPAEERSRLMSEAGKAGWANATEADRKAKGAMLVAARAAARAVRRKAAKKAAKAAKGKAI